jgi:hypothetical protein
MLGFAPVSTLPLDTLPSIADSSNEQPYISLVPVRRPIFRRPPFQVTATLESLHATTDDATPLTHNWPMRRHRSPVVIMSLNDYFVDIPPAVDEDVAIARLHRKWTTKYKPLFFPPFPYETLHATTDDGVPLVVRPPMMMRGRRLLPRPTIADLDLADSTDWVFIYQNTPRKFPKPRALVPAWLFPQETDVIPAVNDDVAVARLHNRWLPKRRALFFPPFPYETLHATTDDGVPVLTIRRRAWPKARRLAYPLMIEPLTAFDEVYVLGARQRAWPKARRLAYPLMIEPLTAFDEVYVLGARQRAWPKIKRKPYVFTEQFEPPSIDDGTPARPGPMRRRIPRVIRRALFVYPETPTWPVTYDGKTPPVGLALYDLTPPPGSSHYDLTPPPGGSERDLIPPPGNSRYTPTPPPGGSSRTLTPPPGGS